jgi:phytoene/squalene synthetase
MNSTINDFLTIFNSIDFAKIKDHPNILIAANFWEEDRYYAARVFYKYMRAVDDMVDHHKAKHKHISPDEKKKFTENVEDWLKLIHASGTSNHMIREMLDLADIFHIPLTPMEKFAGSMLYDINHEGFPTMEAFIEYSKGASVVPAYVFVHLNGITKNLLNYEAPKFDAWEAATPCAIFSYLVHIIRDFQKDQLDNLNYFADNVLQKFGLTRNHLRQFAEGKPVTPNFRMMISDYYFLADLYRRKTLEVMNQILPLHESRYQLSLQIIFDLYLMVFERIDLEHGKFTMEELTPTPEETRQRVYRKILEFEPVGIQSQEKFSYSSNL